MHNWKDEKKNFLKYWTIDKVKKMTLEEYTNTERDNSFTYWLENKTKNVLGIGGGSAYKFGIFKRNQDSEEKQLNKGQKTDGIYGWYAKYGNDTDEAFKKIKELVIKVINTAKNKKFEIIDDIDLGDAYKWKIAFMYAPEESLLRIAKKDTFIFLAKKYNIEQEKISQIQKRLIEMQDEDFYKYSSKLWDEWGNRDNKQESMNEDKNMNSSNISLNQILYGPPGTGKTYHTVNKALEIIDDKFYQKYKDNRKKLQEKFNEYKNSGQIEFITFHQSYGYEEFVEGIKAIPPKKEGNEDNENMIYDVMPGIFKKIVKKSEYQQISSQLDKNIIELLGEYSENPIVWKISLGEKSSIKKECFDNNVIRIGWDDYGNLKVLENIENIQRELKDFFYMKKGDIVLTFDNQWEIDGIGIVTGDYEYDEKIKSHKHKRVVEWIIKNTPINIALYNDNTRLTLSTLYKLSRIKKDDVLKMIGSLGESNSSNIEEEKKYILIIDEINRGNISKIFGELITLIEPSKRIGAKEELKIRLPYSNKEFGVPKNLYIIGTMNTADRSIAPIDTALRRRFVFEEMLPKPNLLKEDLEGISLKKMLEAMNARIEYLYDRDHMIGHTYLMDVENYEDLVFAMKNKIIPLLAEYFYEDWENIRLVLGGNDFIQEKKDNSNYLSNVNGKLRNKKIYEINPGFKNNSKNLVKDFQMIYKDNAKNEPTSVENNVEQKSG